MAYLDTKMAMRQVTRWIIASKQDRDPGIQFLHASYAVGNLDMLRQLMSDTDIERETGINPLAVHREAIQLQDQAQQRLRV